MKQCRKCKKVKEFNDFSKHGKTKDGFQSYCKECANTASKKWGDDNPERLKVKYQRYEERHKEERKAARKRNRPSRRQYERKLRETNINYRLGINLRTRLTKAIKRNQKSGSAVRDLGCSIEDFKLWLEQQFQPGMTWENYGDWHVDHIVPLFSFNLADRSQFKSACHWFNLRPLWAEDNLKRDKK